MFEFMRLTVLLPLAMLAIPAVAQSGPDDDQQALFDALGLADIIQIMREEGVEYGAEINIDLLSSRGGADWEATVERLYNVDDLHAMVNEELFAELGDADITPMVDFFTSDLGRQIIGLEVSARRALLDEAVDEAAKDSAAIAMEDQTPRFLQLETFVVINDLIETNVVGALNANYAFLNGLQAGGVSPAITEDQILTDVWRQEPEIRENTTEWVYSFLNLAYQPLTDEQLNDYIAFSDSVAGQALNVAMFAAFDTMFAHVSSELGIASAVVLSGQDI